MADSDGPLSDTNDPGNPPLPLAKPVAPAPRVNPPNINAPKDAPPAGGPPGFLDFLEWMRLQMGGEAAPGTAGQRGPLPKERKKFQRRDADAKVETPSATPEPAMKAVPILETELPSAAPATSNETPAPSVAAPEAARPAKPPLATPEALPGRVRRQQGVAKRNSWLGLATQLGVLILLAGSFVLGRLSVSKVATPAPAAPAAPEVINSDGKATTNLLTEENAALIDQAMAAEQASDFKKTADLLGKVKASGAHVPGLAFQIAQAAVFDKDYNKALHLLNDAIAQGDNVAEAYNVRATLGSRTGLVRGNGLNDYETATKVDPFGSRDFYYWGAALRRAGKDQAAIVRLQQAIDRLREPELESLYRLTLRLAKIEAGQENEFADELAKQLALPNPSMDWLITAAAEEIHHGQFAAAAGYLDKAEQRGDPESFKLRLQDFYLNQFQYEKELARFYPKATPGQPGDSPTPPGPEAAGPPTIGLDVPVVPPPASPGTSLPH